MFQKVHKLMKFLSGRARYVVHGNAHYELGESPNVGKFDPNNSYREALVSVNDGQTFCHQCKLLDVHSLSFYRSKIGAELEVDPKKVTFWTTGSAISISSTKFSV